MNPLAPTRPFLALALIALTLGFSGVAWAQSRTGPLVLEVTLAGKATLDGETQFAVDLRNTGPVAVTLPARPGWDTDGGLEMRVTRVGERATAARKIPEQVDPTRNAALTASRRGVALPAGEALGLYRTVKTRVLFPSAGEYELVVVYRGWSGGEVVSAPVRVSVIP